MFRKMIFAAAVLILCSMATSASARPHVGGWHHHGHGGPWRALAPALAFGLLAAPFVWGPPAYAYCFVRHERVPTPWGWRWRRVEVCD